LRRPIRRLIIAVIIVAVYVVLAPQPTRWELSVSAMWALDPSAVEPESFSVTRIPFLLDSVFGYVSPQGQLLYRGVKSFSVAISDSAFSNYSRAPEVVIVQAPDGSLLSSLPVAGYPVIIGGRIYTVDRDATRIAEWSTDGGLLWAMDLATPAVSIDADRILTVIGMVSGGLLVVGADGTPLPTDEEALIHGAVLSVAISPVTGEIAAISGGVLQSLAVLGVTDARVTLVAGRPIELLQDRPLLDYTDRGVLFYQSADDIVVLDLAEGVEHLVTVSRTADQLVPVCRDISAVLFSGGEPDPMHSFVPTAELNLVADDGFVPVFQTFAGERVGLSAGDGVLVIAIDDRVLGFTLDTL
jgi:hypothetical protein